MDLSNSKLIMACILIAACTAAGAVDHLDKTVDTINPNTVASIGDCYTFTLVGVSQADPVRPAVGTFALQRTRQSAKEAYATLLAAKVSGTRVMVGTTGQLACGFAEVSYIAAR
jgi:hypothetical protein